MSRVGGKMLISIARRLREPAKRTRAGTALGLANRLSILTRLYGGTDKWEHGYTPYYEIHLGPRRLQSMTVFEIGVGGYKQLAPGGSLAVWRDFLLRSTIIGVDISEKDVHLGNRVIFERADQSKEGELQRVVDRHGIPNIVIDDGSHIAEHIRASFEFFWPLMDAGSLYIIEDLSTSYYPDFGGGNPPPPTSAVGLLQELVDCTQAQDGTFARHPHWGSRSEPRYSGVMAVHAYPGIAFVEKSR